MKKSFKISTLFILLIYFFSSITINDYIKAESIQENNVNLVLDTLNYKDSIPKNFRKTTALAAIKDNKNLNLKGMDKLNISGSQQFSEFNLSSMITAIGPNVPITIIDLRQESHGFINGIPVSWADSKNNANAGLTKEQVLLDEANKLRSIKLNVPISFYNHPDITIIPTKVLDEKKLVTVNELSYVRIPVRDGGIPGDDMVGYFIQFVKAQPKNSWIHFHCKQGVGRTTTFMIMYDMLKNNKAATAEEIINRQIALAGLNEDEIKSFYNEERITFLKKFYEYCKKNDDSSNISEKSSAYLPASVLVPEEKKIYLTFDDGPIPGVTEKLLDVLKEQNIKATFFVVGKEIPEREHILKRIYNEGHTIGLHTYNHKFKKVYKSDDIFIDEMLQTRKKINEILNISPTAIRFPAGSSGRMTQELLDKLHSNNMRVFDWTIDLHDGCSSGASVSELIRNGRKFNPKYTRLIILAHCNSNNINTVKALPEIIKFYKELGYEFAAIGEDTPDYYYRLKGNKSKKVS